LCHNRLWFAKKLDGYNVYNNPKSDDPTYPPFQKNFIIQNHAIQCTVNAFSKNTSFYFLFFSLRTRFFHNAASQSSGFPSIISLYYAKYSRIKKTMSTAIVHITSQAVLEEHCKVFPIVLVDFWAPWCGPCKNMNPILDQLAQTAQGKFSIVKFNIDEAPDLAAAYEIVSIPSFLLFVNGRHSDTRVGSQNVANLSQWLAHDHNPA